MNILNKKSGFTLMEAMVVVLVISILAAAGVPYYMDHLERQKAAIGITDLRMIADSVERYMTLHPNSVPTKFSLLDADIDSSKLNDDHDVYNNGNFTFSIIKGDSGYVQGERIGGSYSLRFTLDEGSRLCCTGNQTTCEDKLGLEYC